MVVPIQWKYKSAIVECDWLKENIDNPLVRVYDCSTYLNYTDDHPSTRSIQPGSGYRTSPLSSSIRCMSCSLAFN